MNLKKYLYKRDLKKSQEPKAKIVKDKGPLLHFVVQKHAASHLHYDFRLEVKGVLMSWAVPKGPSLDPTVKRLAIHVEDHPFDYRKFEGIIPSGYGAGTVMVWDQGTYHVEDKTKRASERLIQDGLKKGQIHFTLNGTKLKGKFSLVHLKKENEWLLIKRPDEFASTEDITQKNRSVISNKTLEEISKKTSVAKKVKADPKPHRIKPMLTTLIDKPFDSPEWFFEIKLDGFRAIAELQGKKNVDLYSRNFQSFNERFPTLVHHLKQLDLDAILDGEIVALDKNGVSHFQLLQNYKTEKNIYFYVFDILYLNGEDLRFKPLIERKSILHNILKSDGLIRYLDHIEREGEKFFEICKKQGLEGIIGKKKQSTYKSAVRSKEWVKIKFEPRQEVVICGFTEPKRSRKNFGALVVGVYKNKKLHFAGHVGGGFTEKQLVEIKKQLMPLITKQCPFEKIPETNGAVRWVKPTLLCEVKFKEWTSTGSMRMPIFLGIRTDKSPRLVKKETKNEYDFITHKEKLYWEKEKITKGDLLNYYESIASFILPYLIDRPETLKRFPNGISKSSFFQKNITTYPPWLSTCRIQHHQKEINYALIQDKRSLLYLVNLGCIEIHPWFSRIDHLKNPDFLIFDLDPVEIAFSAVVKVALALHAILDAIEVPNYCKTSGSRGLHIALPLQGKYTYEQAKKFAELIATVVHQQLGKITSLERSPTKRKNRVYIDCYQNNFGQTIAAPYSVRAKRGAPVSMPLLWEEVNEDLDPNDYTIFNTAKRLQQKGDLFKPVLGSGADLKKALNLLQQLLGRENGKKRR